MSLRYVLQIAIITDCKNEKLWRFLPCIKGKKNVFVKKWVNVTVWLHHLLGNPLANRIIFAITVLAFPEAFVWADVIGWRHHPICISRHLKISVVAREINKSMPVVSDWIDFVYFSCYVWIQALLMNINFPQNFPLALIGCLSAHAPIQPWALQLLLGSSTVQTYCALCA